MILLSLMSIYAETQQGEQMRNQSIAKEEKINNKTKNTSKLNHFQD